MIPAAAEYTIMWTAVHRENPSAAPEPGRLSFRERELIALVAQGQTDAQIAGKLFITISTARSHLHRIRDKSGCRRRADLTAWPCRKALSDHGTDRVQQPGNTSAVGAVSHLCRQVLMSSPAGMRT